MFPDNFVKVLPGSSSSTNLHQTVDGDVVQLRNKKRCKVELQRRFFEDFGGGLLILDP